MKRMGIVLLTFVTLFAVLTPYVSSYDPYGIALDQKNLAPSWTHFFGTDDLGRDLCVRVAIGTRVSLTIAFSAVILDMLIGVCYGAVAGYFGGRIDDFMMRIVDILYALPFVLLITILLLFLPKGILSIIFAIACIKWVTMARIIRGQVQVLKHQDYITAAKLFGAKFPHIFFVHLLPNLYGTILVTTTLTIPYAIFSESYVGFLGLGISSPHASLGTLARDAYHSLRFYPWRLFYPSIVIVMTILGCHLLGSGLRRSLEKSC